MKFNRYTLDDCHQATGVVLRIDAFDFAMPIVRKDGFLIMQAVRP